MFTQEHLAFFVDQGRAWAADTNATLHPQGRPLADALIGRFMPFFRMDTLCRIRVVALPLIPNPPFYSVLASQGVPAPLDFTQMAGITFLDTVLISRTITADLSETDLTSLLFHEAVHVVQYEHLGLDRFMHEYVMGWADNGLEYRNIPLEQQAYALQDRFDENPSAVFSVHIEVNR